MKIVVGSTNKAKISAVQQCMPRIFPDLANEQISVIGVKVPSGVSDQPMSDEECIEGAKNRALAVLKSQADADFGVGVEGGVQKIGDRWFESGWIAVVDKQGKYGYGSSARFELGPKIMERILAGVELADIIDDLTGKQDVRSNAGAMGIITNGILNRDYCYTHGIYFAFAPWMSDAKYWE